MKKRVLKKVAILAAPIIWRKLRGRRGRHRWGRRHHWRGRHHWYGHRRPRFGGHKRRGIWL